MDDIKSTSSYREDDFMLLTQADIQAALAIYVPVEEAAIRAHWVFEDMNKLGFELRLSTENPPGMWNHIGVIHQVEYVIPPSGFDINSADDNAALAGSFVTCGNLLRLSQCVKLGRRYLPALWPEDFACRLLNAEHLSALNEIWWLKFWRGIESVERGPKANKAAPDFEWLLRLRAGLASCQINLEVKRRPGNVNQYFKHGRPNASLSGIAKKFCEVPENAANVVALTVFFPLAADAWRWVLDWFQQQAHVHGILIWTEGNLGATPLLKQFKPEKRWVEFLVNDAEAEDLKVAGRTAGTLCTASEAPEFIRKLADKHNRPTIYHP